MLAHSALGLMLIFGAIVVLEDAFSVKVCAIALDATSLFCTLSEMRTSSSDRGVL